MHRGFRKLGAMWGKCKHAAQSDASYCGRRTHSPPNVIGPSGQPKVAAPGPLASAFPAVAGRDRLRSGSHPALLGVQILHRLPDIVVHQAGAQVALARDRAQHEVGVPALVDQLAGLVQDGLRIWRCHGGGMLTLHGPVVSSRFPPKRLVSAVFRRHSPTKPDPAPGYLGSLSTHSKTAP